MERKAPWGAVERVLARMRCPFLKSLEGKMQQGPKSGEVLLIREGKGRRGGLEEEEEVEGVGGQ